MVTIDTLRADHLGCYGYFRPTSPSLDALAAESVLFERAVTTMSTTLPAHVSLFTSRYPLQTGVTTNGRKIKLQAESGNRVRFLAQMLTDLGYATAAFVSANPVKRYTGIDVGFDHFDQPETGEPGGRRGKANETTDAVLDWLAAPPPSPFFLWVHYFDPHKPYAPPPPYDRAFTTDDELLAFVEGQGIPNFRDEEILDAHNLYDGEILFVDTQIARLVSRLRELELFDDLTFVLTSDHGEALGEHERIGHGEIYNEQLFVPLMIKLPSGSPLNGERIGRVVSLADVIPTLVETLNLELSPEDAAQLTGVNALADRASRPYALAQRTTRKGRKWGPGERFALVGEEWKYLYETEGPEMLFDLRRDPVELDNLSEAEPEVAERLRDKLLSELAELSQSAAGLEVVEEVSPEVVEELRALGYID